MYPRPFSYVRAESVEHAVAVLAEHGGEAAVLAGGASLIPLMKYRLRSPRVLVDIGGLGDELNFVAADGSHLRVGALVRHADAEDGAADGQPLLGEVAATIADRQVRNMGTVVGGLCAVEPTGDWVPALLALRGSVLARSRRGVRQIPADELVVGPFTTTLQPDELVVEARFPAAGAGSGTAHEKLTIKVNAGIVNCSVALAVDGDGAIADIGIAVGALQPRPLRAVAAEEMLRGAVPAAALVEAAAAEALAGADAVTDARSDADHRRAAAMTLLRRAVARAHAAALAAEAVA